jgi:hypothetical protein
MTGLTLNVEGQAVTPAVDAEEKFQRLVRQWRKETRHLSSVKTISMNEAYQKIIGMGKAALPFILRDLQRTRDHWLWALNAIADENPASNAKEFDESVEAWLEWGKNQGYLP